MEDCQRLLDILGRYEAISGQAVNRQKISLFFSKNGARVMTKCGKYLGLSMLSGKSKVETF